MLDELIYTTVTLELLNAAEEDVDGMEAGEEDDRMETVLELYTAVLDGTEVPVDK